MVKNAQKYKELNQKGNNKTPTKKVGASLIFFVLLILVSMCMGMIFSPVFNVTEIVAKDGENVSSAEISQVVNVEFRRKYFKAGLF